MKKSNHVKHFKIMIARDKDVGSKTHMSEAETLECMMILAQIALLVKIVVTRILNVGPLNVMENIVTGGLMEDA